MAVTNRTRRAVVLRAEGRCEFCRLPVSTSAIPPHVDHVRARQHRGGDDPSNLALSCDRCNLHKGTNLSGVDPQTDAVASLFNPRGMAWDDHFAAVGAEVVGRTAEGRATVETLQMNEPRRLERRAEAIEAGEWP